jgi:CRISPR-associated protein Csb2
MTHLLLTVRFLDDRYHGLLDRGGPPEWPPSPFRLFQAMVAGVARRGELDIAVGKSLEWLQMLEAPIIIAPKSKTGQAITRFVPNNDGDKKFDRQERLTAKPTIPTLFLLEPDQKPEVHYIWDISSQSDAPIDRIRDAARSLTTLGWGIDMAFADARSASQEEVESLSGVRWHPKADVWRDVGMLRTPTFDQETKQCSLCDLRQCHEIAMNRIEHGKPLRTIDKPKIFERVFYSSTERPIGRPTAVFKLLDDNDDAYRYPHAKLIHIAGMMRHLAIERMVKDPPPWIEDSAQWVNRVVRGKRDVSSTDEHKQFSYVPLPSIGHEHADAMIRNVMIVAPLGMDRELAHLAERLNGELLEPEGEAEGYKTDSTALIPQRIELQKFIPPRGKFIDKYYLSDTAHVWQTVTPVILDGHTKKTKADKPEEIARQTQKLICKALQRARIESPCEFTWQAIPFLKNCLSAHKYDRDGRHTGYHRPAHLKDLTAVHVRLAFTDPVPGPIAIGAGRHCGLGLFAAVDPQGD